MRWSRRPVILLGHGVRAAGAAHLAPLLLKLGIPVLASWQAKDLVDNDHPMFYGCPGIYGNRAANAVMHEADMILSIGNRMAIWNVGYEGPRADQRIVMVDVDEAEVRKFPHAEWVEQDAREFIEDLIANPGKLPHWRWRAVRPRSVVESPAHDDRDGYINSYRFVDRLNEHLREDECITIDCGSAAACAFQALRVRPPMRILSSGGLGEMGCALPYAIGASFARGKRDVLCLVGDGGLMLNLQELQTIVHHKLPVKIIVFRNDGYLMIRHTESAIGMKECAVDPASGVSFPRFQQLAYSFGIAATGVRSWQEFDTAIPSLIATDGPALVEYFMHPRQVIAPKLGYVMKEGKQSYARFDQMSPSRVTAVIGADPAYAHQRN